MFFFFFLFILYVYLAFMDLEFPLFFLSCFIIPQGVRRSSRCFCFSSFHISFSWVALRCVHCHFPLAIVQKVKIMAQREYVPFLGLEILVELHTRFSMHSRVCRTQNWALIIKLNTEQNVSQVTMLEYMHDGRRCRTDVAYWATYSLGMPTRDGW